LGVGLWFSALTVQFRDTTHVLPFLLQLWFWATPVAYGSDLVPPKLHWLHWLNPMTVVVDGFRWAILGTPPPSPPAMTICGTITLLLLASGILFFRQMERQFADVI
jgi:lipopolysaccharide transport system permease protein